MVTDRGEMCNPESGSQILKCNYVFLQRTDKSAKVVLNQNYLKISELSEPFAESDDVNISLPSALL